MRAFGSTIRPILHQYNKRKQGNGEGQNNARKEGERNLTITKKLPTHFIQPSVPKRRKFSGAVRSTSRGREKYDHCPFILLIEPT